MNLLPLTHEIATRYGWDGKVARKYGYQSEPTKKNFHNWSRRYTEAIGVRDLKFTPVDEDYIFDDDPNKIYLLRYHDVKKRMKTYYIPIHDRNLVNFQNYPMTGLFLKELRDYEVSSSDNLLVLSYITGPMGWQGFGRQGYYLEGYYLFRNSHSFMNWDEAPWSDVK
jgi:hypothetical protein